MGLQMAPTSKLLHLGKQPLPNITSGSQEHIKITVLLPNSKVGTPCYTTV